VGPELTDILGSLAAMVGLVILLKVWHPKDKFALPGDKPAPPRRHIPTGELLHAWSPYALLVLFVLIWSYKPIQAQLAATQIRIPWPGLHNMIQQVSPVVANPTPYAAVYNFNWLGASGTSCLIVALLSALILGMKPAVFFQVLGATIRQLLLAELTMGAVLGLAFLMNYSGSTATLGLAFAATGATFPFFSALLGWLGVFLTGSDTSANALFGNLQVVTAKSLGMNATLMASANSAGGVMGKMISLTSVAVASAATSMGAGSDESKLFRFTLKHSVFLACVIGLITVFYAYVAPDLAP
jgi:lactate permease